MTKTLKTFVHTSASGNTFDAVKLADLIALLAHATGQEQDSIAKIVVPTGADYALIFRPKAPKAEKPKASEGPAPQTDDYQYCEVEGVKYRWRAGMADWQKVPLAAPPPPKPMMEASPPPKPGAMVSNAALIAAARRKTRKGA